MVLATVGSLGDLHPFLALGRALQERGARVVIAAAVEYRTKVERAGLIFCPVRPSFDDMQQELGMDRAGLTAAVLSRTDFMFRRLIIPNVRAAYEDMLPLTSGADMVLTSSLAFGARLAAEKSATPRIGIVLQPFMFLSAFDIPAIPTVPWLSSIIQRLGPLPSRGVVWAIRRAADSLLHPIHALRREIGLPSTRRNPLFDGQFSTAGAIGLYSNLLGSAATELGILMGDTGYQMRSVRLREVLRAEDGAAQAARIVLDRIESAQSKNGDVDDELSP